MTDLGALPNLLTVEQLHELTGVPARTIWRTVREGTCPWTPLRLGPRSIRFATAPVLASLGIAPTRDEGPADPPGPATTDHRSTTSYEPPTR